MRLLNVELTVPQALLLALGVVVGLTLVIAASTSGTAFGTYNPAWDGSSDLRTTAENHSAETVVITETTQYDRLDGNGTIAFVIAPDEPYDDADLTRLNAFLDRGGTIVIADDRPDPTNTLLADLGTETRIDGDPLRDEHLSEHSPAFPRVFPVADHQSVDGIDSLLLNHGTALTANESTVLVRSSEYAYLDRNRNNELDPDETPMAHPIITAESVENGEVIVISDPSIFINVMLEDEGNQAFTTQLLADKEHVAFDISHAESPPPLRLALLTLRDSSMLQLLLGVFALGVIIAWERRITNYVRDHWSYFLSSRDDTIGSSEPIERDHSEWCEPDSEQYLTALRQQDNGDADFQDDTT